VTSQPEWRGEKGRLTPDKLEGYCGGDLEGTFFLCGPLAMIWSIRRHLRRSGVPRRRIRQEQFVFLT
jgi:predicted ferric reductase